MSASDKEHGELSERPEWREPDAADVIREALERDSVAAALFNLLMLLEQSDLRLTGLRLRRFSQQNPGPFVAFGQVEVYQE